MIDESYSSSEGAGVTYIAGGDWLTHPGSVDKALLGTVLIVGDDGDELRAGQVGEVYVEGGCSFEYLNDVARTEVWRLHPARPNRADEIVGAALYLASDAASYTTGSRMRVDGGLTRGSDVSSQLDRSFAGRIRPTTSPNPIRVPLAPGASAEITTSSPSSRKVRFWSPTVMDSVPPQDNSMNDPC